MNILGTIFAEKLKRKVGKVRQIVYYKQSYTV